MTVSFSRINDGQAVLASFTGRLKVTDVCEPLENAFTDGRFPRGVDRVLYLDPDAELSNLDLGALKEIQDRVLKREMNADGKVKFRAVLVCPNEIHQGILKLYKSVWDVLKITGVDFTVVNNLESAFEILRDTPAFGEHLPE